jgi:hypothetical protein
LILIFFSTGISPQSDQLKQDADQIQTSFKIPICIQFGIPAVPSVSNANAISTVSDNTDSATTSPNVSTDDDQDKKTSDAHNNLQALDINTSPNTYRPPSNSCSASSTAAPNSKSPDSYLTIKPRASTQNSTEVKSYGPKLSTTSLRSSEEDPITLKESLLKQYTENLTYIHHIHRHIQHNNAPSKYTVQIQPPVTLSPTITKQWNYNLGQFNLSCAQLILQHYIEAAHAVLSQIKDIDPTYTPNQTPPLLTTPTTNPILYSPFIPTASPANNPSMLQTKPKVGVSLTPTSVTNTLCKPLSSSKTNTLTSYKPTNKKSTSPKPLSHSTANKRDTHSLVSTASEQQCNTSTLPKPKCHPNTLPKPQFHSRASTLSKPLSHTTASTLPKPNFHSTTSNWSKRQSQSTASTLSKQKFHTKPSTLPKPKLHYTASKTLFLSRANTLQPLMSVDVDFNEPPCKKPKIQHAYYH